MSFISRWRRKKARKARPVYQPFLERLEPRVTPSTYNWIGASGGSWDTLTNWQVGGVTASVLPGIGDDVSFGSFNGTVTHATSVSDTVNSLTGTQATLSLSGSGSLSIVSTTTGSTIANLIQSSGTLGGAGSLSVSGLTTWSGGTMSGTGVTNANGSLQMSNGVTLSGGRTLNNAAAATWSSGFIDIGSGGGAAQPDDG